MVAILDDILALFIVPGLMPYAGLIIGVFVGYEIINFLKNAIAKK